MASESTTWGDQLRPAVATEKDSCDASQKGRRMSEMLQGRKWLSSSSSMHGGSSSSGSSNREPPASSRSPSCHRRHRRHAAATRSHRRRVPETRHNGRRCLRSSQKHRRECEPRLLRGVIRDLGECEPRLLRLRFYYHDSGNLMKQTKGKTIKRTKNDSVRIGLVLAKGRRPKRRHNSIL